MAVSTGTFGIQSLLAARFQSVAEFGLNTVEEVLREDLAAHNAIVLSMIQELAETTTDRQRIYGSSTSGDMVEVDEYGRAPSQKSVTGATVAFPLKAFQFNLGWTEKWLQTRTPADLAQMVLQGEKAHMRSIQREIKKALYLSSNYTFRDHLVDDVDLAVKRFVNADGAAIPDGPNGETFDGSSHTHYDAATSLTANGLTALIDDVVEHGHGNTPVVAISRTDEVAVRALTGFTAYVDPRVIYRNTDTPGQAVDLSRLDNRAIGIFHSAEVWVKPWAIANYYACYDMGGEMKPLAYRQRTVEALQGLRIAAQNSAYPLIAQFLEAEFGVGVWTRTKGAVLFIDAGGSYVDPTIS